MKKNIGTFDRLLRLGLGIVFLGLAYWFSSWILLAVAIFCIYQAAASWCVLYQILGKNTCSIETPKAK